MERHIWRWRVQNSIICDGLFAEGKGELICKGRMRCRNGKYHLIYKLYIRRDNKAAVFSVQAFNPFWGGG